MSAPQTSSPDEAWKLRYRAPQVLTSAIAWAAPARGIAATNTSGQYQLYRWDTTSDTLAQLTARPEGLVQGTISPDGRFVYYFDDRQGQEVGHFVRLPYEAALGAAPKDITPDMPLYSLASSPGGLSLCRAGTRLAFLAAYQNGFDLCAVDLQPDGALDAPRILFHSARDALGPVLSYNGEVGVIASDERTGKGRFSLRAFDMASGRALAELWDGPESSLECIAFSPVEGDTRLLAMTNRTGTDTLLLWDPVSGQRTDLHWPELTGATRAFDWSPDGTRIVLRTLEQAAQQFYVYTMTTQTLTRLDHPSGTYRNAYFASAKEIFVHQSDSTHPTQLVALDANTGRLRRTVLATGNAPAGRPWRSIEFASSDGQPIQGWLATPEGTGPFPTVLEAHGGPFVVQTDSFSPSSQAWLDHGYAYLTINYRGSTTFGRAFQEQIAGHPGHWEVEDLAAAREWLVREGIADPAQVFLTGWSYGGYLTLQALATKPELWAGGMAGSPIADWRRAYAEASESMRVGVASFFGGTPEEKPEAYAASSPISSVERVRAPILIIQGRNDSRAPAGPVEEYARRLKAAGATIEAHWYETGHLGPLLQVEEGIRHQEVMLAFASKLLHRAPMPAPAPAPSSSVQRQQRGLFGRMIRRLSQR